MSRPRLLLAARIGFVLVTIGCAWWSFRGRWSEIGDQVLETGPLDLGVAFALTALGLLGTALIWRHVLARLGAPVPHRDAAAIFLIGQLGKYIPGSVWTFAAQAQLGRRHQVPPRASVTASAVFLLIHTFSGAFLGSVLAAADVIDTRVSWWWWTAAALGSAVLLSPPVVRRGADRMVGRDTTVRFGAADLAFALCGMAVVWVAYGAAVGALLDVRTAEDLVVATGAFGLGFAAGVLMVLAPAGLGAREGVLIALLGPAFGVGPAAAAALLARVVHASADFAVAVIARAAARQAASVDDSEDAHAAVG
ncbi:lysylphosphatidylglycerol synthase domain-containing protein [Nocardioides stalactiti]|uniref:lysylphosphatidylglycerol synthase domain-containing protein n=1 Tax=Nocardioides stalactiti TaxID=2755356 RepID=UPI0016010DE8|nr:lysylphosphatidylglycerol synthase domain-containing protein [Nocardioides stalactiti]